MDGSENVVDMIADQLQQVYRNIGNIADTLFYNCVRSGNHEIVSQTLVQLDKKQGKKSWRS